MIRLYKAVSDILGHRTIKNFTTNQQMRGKLLVLSEIGELKKE